MRWLLWAAGLIVLAVICFAAYRAFSMPTFYLTLMGSIVAAILPAILKHSGDAKSQKTVREGGTPHIKMPGPKPSVDRKPVVKKN